MYTQLTAKSRAVLEQVKQHPNITSAALADAMTATHTRTEIAQSLFTLWNGRYITRQKGNTKGGQGILMYEYSFLRDNPRRRPQHGKKRRYVRRAPSVARATPVSAPVVTTGVKGIEVFVMIANKDGRETLMLTVAQAKQLKDELAGLGV